MKNKLYLICILLCMLNSSYGQSQPSKESSFKMYGSDPTSLREQIDKREKKTWKKVKNDKKLRHRKGLSLHVIPDLLYVGPFARKNDYCLGDSDVFSSILFRLHFRDELPCWKWSSNTFSYDITLITDSIGNLIGIYDVHYFLLPKSFLSMRGELIEFETLAHLYRNREIDFAFFQREMSGTFFCVKGYDLFVLKKESGEMRRYSWKDFVERFLY